jgi:hypothetical protein
LGSQTDKLLWQIAPQTSHAPDMPTVALSPQVNHQSLNDATTATVRNDVAEVKNRELCHLIVPRVPLTIRHLS